MSGTVSTTGTSCDTLSSGQSCLGQRVTFTATVGDPAGSNGSPSGTVAFIDENGVTLGVGSLTANVDGTTSNAVFKTTILTATGTGSHSIAAQYLNDLSGSWKNSRGTTSWQVVGRPTTVTVSATTPTVVGTTEPLSASVTDAGPAPLGVDQNGNPVQTGSFF
ncbi:MAG TPA: hypothetical protein VKB56_10140, partial [Terriglobales bacterium]|nr:hypothetical protein [Terriglobales bacterium]